MSNIMSSLLLLVLGVSLAYCQDAKYNTDEDTLIVEQNVALGVGAIVGIVIGSFVCLIGCCVLICRCCCGCCQKKETYIHTTVISPQAQVPSTMLNINYPYPQPTAPLVQEQGNAGFTNQMYEQPPPQYTK